MYPLPGFIFSIVLICFTLLLSPLHRKRLFRVLSVSPTRTGCEVPATRTGCEVPATCPAHAQHSTQLLVHHRHSLLKWRNEHSFLFHDSSVYRFHFAHPWHVDPHAVLQFAPWLLGKESAARWSVVPRARLSLMLPDHYAGLWRWGESAWWNMLAAEERTLQPDKRPHETPTPTSTCISTLEIWIRVSLE